MEHEAIGTAVQEVKAGRMTRRELVQRLGAVGLAAPAIAAALAACDTNQAPPEAQTSTGMTDGTSTSPMTPPVVSGAIPGPPWEGGTHGGVGLVGWPDESVVYDPPVAYDFGGYYGLPNFYRGLYYPGLDNEFGLDLADAVDIDDSATRYRFSLRQGVTFHNGREVKAEDFKWTFERSSSKDLASWVQGFLGSVRGHGDFVAGKAKEIAGIRVVDDYTLELQLDRPDVTIPGALGIPPFYVLPREEVERLGDRFTFNPIGCGPFKLDNYDQGGSKYEASRFEQYVYADQLPYLDGLDWQWNIPIELEALRTERGELDAGGGNMGTALSVVARLSRSPELEDQFDQWNSLFLVWFEFDVKSEPFNDKRVRQAFNYALDRKRFESLQINPTGHFWPPDLLGYDDSLPTYEHDPERAKSLLTEAGYGDGLDIVLPILSSGPNPEGRWEQLVAQDLKAVGVNVELKKDTAGIFDLGPKLPSKYRFWAMSWGMGLPDPSELVNSLIGTNAPSNYGGYSNPEIDRLGARGQQETDREARAALYTEAERLLLEDAAFMFVGIVKWSTLHSERLENFVWEPAVWQHWDRYWITA